MILSAIVHLAPVCLSAGLRRNDRPLSNETWWKDVAWAKEEHIKSFRVYLIWKFSILILHLFSLAGGQNNLGAVAKPYNGREKPDTGSQSVCISQ